MNYATSFQCIECGKTYDISIMRYLCDKCKAYLEITYDFPADIRRRIETAARLCQREPILRRWQDVLPLKNSDLIDIVSIGERETPLMESSRLGDHIRIKTLFLKCEHYLPTCSLKDRSMALVVAKALEYNYSTVSIVSSGNAASSLAAYASKAGLKSVIFVRSKSNPSKFSKALLTGAILVRIDSHLADIAKSYELLCKEYSWYDCNGTVNPFRCEAKKTCAYEIASQLDWNFPDWVLVPTSTGNGLVACGIGFRELYNVGLISKIPKLVAVQLEACAPIYTAFQEGRQNVTPVVPDKSVSDTLLNGNPEAGSKVLDWVRNTDGRVLTVTDDETIEAMKYLGHYTGLFSEPAGAVSIAAAKKMRISGEINENDVVVCLITGHGLNQPDIALQISDLGPVIPNEFDAIKKYINSNKCAIN